MKGTLIDVSKRAGFSSYRPTHRPLARGQFLIWFTGGTLNSIHRIRVNTLSPGPTDTAMFDRFAGEEQGVKGVLGTNNRPINEVHLGQVL
jgi:hypothetical protein